jgi:hypothetical protein
MTFSTSLVAVWYSSASLSWHLSPAINVSSPVEAELPRRTAFDALERFGVTAFWGRGLPPALERRFIASPLGAEDKALFANQNNTPALFRQCSRLPDVANGLRPWLHLLHAAEAAGAALGARLCHEMRGHEPEAFRIGEIAHRMPPCAHHASLLGRRDGF